jgi:hypothetical protein
MRSNSRNITCVPQWALLDCVRWVIKETTKTTAATIDVECLFEHIHPMCKIGRLIQLSELHVCLIKRKWNTDDHDECGYDDGVVDYGKVVTETRTLIDECFPDNDLEVKSHSCHQGEKSNHRHNNNK